MQEAKALAPSVFSPEPKVTLCSLLLENALAPMDSSESGKVTLVKEQPENALSPMRFSVFSGKVTLVSFDEPKP